MKTPTRPPRRQPVATNGAPVGRIATASSVVTPQSGATRLSSVAETSGDQDEKLVSATSAWAPRPITAMAPPGVEALIGEGVGNHRQTRGKECWTPRGTAVTALRERREAKQPARQDSHQD